MTKNSNGRDPGDGPALRSSTYLPRSIIDWLTGDGSDTPEDDDVPADTKEPIS